MYIEANKYKKIYIMRNRNNAFIISFSINKINFVAISI